LKISVIIPTLNEGSILQDTLSRLQAHFPYEIIIGDGGSTDETLTIARTNGTRLISAERGRASQMNAGAKEATGEVLLFLHADSSIDAEGYRAMIQVMKQEHLLGGAFSLHIDSDRLGLRLISWLATLRSRYLNLTYGDQAIFVRARVFHDIGGFPRLHICEDLDFFRKLKNQGPVILLPNKASTSPRRWLAEGLAFNTLRNIAITVLFILGFSPEKLSRWYQPQR
jgi:rSAM/selenodomain-associated transferase 2